MADAISCERRAQRDRQSLRLQSLTEAKFVDNMENTCNFAEAGKIFLASADLYTSQDELATHLCAETTLCYRQRLATHSRGAAVGAVSRGYNIFRSQCPRCCEGELGFAGCKHHCEHNLMKAS
jgi:hypothetical protein